MELRGAVAVVTGASAGIGEATAIELARRGAKVVLAARRLERLETLADRIEAAGGTALAVHCDVSETEQLQALPTVVAEAVGPCDILVNNAGIPGGGEFEDLSFEQIERLVHVNLLGVLLGTRAFLPGMLNRRKGHIVNVASLAGRFAPPRAAVYTATKHGVVAFSESLNYETEGRDVLVTSINPGFVATEAFTHESIDRRLVMRPDRVAAAIARVVRDRIAPEYSIPRWVAPLQLFRVATPPVYRWGMRLLRRGGHEPTPAR